MSDDKLSGEPDFLLHSDFAPAHCAKTTSKWLADCGITVLEWSANLSELNPRENLCSIVRRKMRDTKPNNTNELKATI